MTFKEYFAIKSLTTGDFAETVCMLFDDGYINEDKDSFLQRVLGDNYSEYLSLINS